MGIKELWPFLNPYCERKPLYELQGKIVAIDLAGWICESLCVVDYEVQAKFYLRNLFFRTCYLLLSGITPVFVLEGTAPVLKHQMISKRNQIQFRGAKPRNNDQMTQTQDKATQPSQQKPSKGRTRFNYVLKQCEELIRSMGLQCVQGPGEAEAFCAHLNANGMVDGVISQDSDCFGYGARRVFRNFTLSMQGTAGSIGGSVDIYDLNVVQKSVDFGRNKIIVMALLCGCDYCPEGVGGVGRDAVQKLFTIYAENEILEKIRLWRKNDTKFTELEIKVDDKKLCSSCGHYGRVQSHTKNGCAPCKMHVGCDSSIWKDKRMAIKSELQIRKKAMSNEDFPSEDIIDEFMQEPIPMAALQLDWCQPNVVKFVRMMGSTLQWNEIYCFQKFLPLLTRWQLHHLAGESTTAPFHGNVAPDFIKKKRTPKGVPSYEIIWKDERKQFLGLIPDDQMELYYTTSKEKDQIEAQHALWSTIEPMDLVEKAYPELVERFQESKAKGKSKKCTKTQDDPEKPTKASRSRRKKPNDEVTNENADIPQKKNPKPRKKKDEKLQTIDLFLRREKPSNVYQSPKIKTSFKPLNLSALAMDDSYASFNDDNMDLSGIINEMVSRPPHVTEFNGKKLRFEEFERPEKCDQRTDEKINDVAKESIAKVVDESFDEFDLLVLRKGNKGPLTNFEKKIDNCSTPVLQSRNSVNPTVEDIYTTPILNKSKNRKSTNLVSSFFMANPDDDIDLFEKSIDFRNMEDVDSDSSEEHDSPSNHDDSDDVINQHDTLDRFFGLI